MQVIQDSNQQPQNTEKPKPDPKYMIEDVYHFELERPIIKPENQIAPAKWFSDLIHSFEKHTKSYIEPKKETILKKIMQQRQNQPQKRPPQHDSKLIVQLVDYARFAESEMLKFTRSLPNSTPKQIIIFEFEKDEYMSHTIIQHAERIVSIIDGMVTLDGHGEAKFSNYKDLLENMKNAKKMERAKYLSQLINIADSIQPVEQEYKVAKVLVPTDVSKRQVEKK